MENFEILFKDADDNYMNGRYMDSYNGFSYLYNKATEMQSIHNAIYFGYRKLICLDLVGDGFGYLSSLYDLAITILQNAARKLNSSIGDTNDLYDKSQHMELLDKILVSLGEEQTLSKLRNILVEMYDKIINEHDRDISSKIMVYQNILSLHKRLEDKNAFKFHLDTLAGLYTRLNNSDDTSVNLSSKLLNEQRKYFENYGYTDTLDIIDGLID